MGADKPSVRYNVALVLEDMAAKGWLQNDLAGKAGLTEQRVSLFIRGVVQTAPTAKKIAGALKRSVRRYLLAAAADSRAAHSDLNDSDPPDGVQRESLLEGSAK